MSKEKEGKWVSYAEANHTDPLVSEKDVLKMVSKQEKIINEMMSIRRSLYSYGMKGLDDNPDAVSEAQYLQDVIVEEANRLLNNLAEAARWHDLKTHHKEIDKAKAEAVQ